MSSTLIPAALVLAVAAAPALASDLEVEVLSGGAASVTAAPGSTIELTLVAELCDASNLGLAGLSIDLAYDGGVLAQFADPTVQPMVNFASPLGMANPAGFGGTAVGGDLIQIGGAQNTLNQGFAPQPTGAVVIAVAHPGSPETLVSGSLQVPNTPGTYTVSAPRARANVIAEGATGFPFWEVEPADVVVKPLVITVAPTLTVDVASLSVATGGSATFGLDAGPVHGGRLHLMLGSVTGTTPATQVGGLSVPLVLDPYTLFALSQPGAPPLVGGFGALDGQGVSSASFVLPPASAPSLAGTTLHHAFVLLLPSVDFASNAVTFDLVP